MLSCLNLDYVAFVVSQLKKKKEKRNWTESAITFFDGEPLEAFMDLHGVPTPHNENHSSGTIQSTNNHINNVFQELNTQFRIANLLLLELDY